MITVRGENLKVSIEKSQRQKTTLSNMHRAAAFLKKSGVCSESYLLCHKSAKILSTKKRGLGRNSQGLQHLGLARAEMCGMWLSLNGWESFEN